MVGGSGSALSVLVVDDEPTIRDFLSAVLGEEGFAVSVACNLEEALDFLGESQFDILVADKNLPDGSGIDLAQFVQDNELPCEVVIITAYGNLQSALQAMSYGVAEYIEKPFADIDGILAAFARVVRLHRLKVERQQLIDELTQKNELLAELAVRDPLTLLHTHVYLQDAMEREISRSELDANEFALLFLDLDLFREVNDSFGHVTGNGLIKRVSELVRGLLRPEEIAARWGGDELAVILPNTSRGQAVERAESLRLAVEEHDFSSLGIGAQNLSVGVSSFPRDGKDRTTLVQSAELALYSAKQTGRNRTAAYSETMKSLERSGAANTGADARLLMALERSIAARDFDFVYQPIVYADNVERAFAFEALCRPRASEFPNPLSLIYAAERAGRIAPLGRALREGGIQALSKLPQDSVMFLNLHPQEIYDPEFNSVEAFLAEWAGQVVFEITEVAGINDYGPVKEIISRLRGAGFRIALDDLGAGYSGLNSLALLEPDFVKLDMDLVHSVTDDARARRLVRHIIEFASGEGMVVVAEGVETEPQRRMLTGLGCRLLQGFLFCRGVPIDEVLERYG